VTPIPSHPATDDATLAMSGNCLGAAEIENMRHENRPEKIGKNRRSMLLMNFSFEILTPQKHTRTKHLSGFHLQKPASTGMDSADVN